MGTPADKPSTFSPQAVAPTKPERILVQTRTHLVPGDDYGQRTNLMRNVICQRLWNRDFIWGQDRWNIYGGDFAYHDRVCFFLIDRGKSAAEPPVQWYRWNGESLIAVNQPLPAKIQSKLLRYPFTPPLQVRVERPTIGAPPPWKPSRFREVIQMRLRRNMLVTGDDIVFLKGHPTDARWVKNNVEPRLWEKILLYCKLEGEEPGFE